jgi:hypothetical protein
MMIVSLLNLEKQRSIFVLFLDTTNHQENGDEERSDSPIEYDSIRTVNYRFVMATSEDLKIAYQTIAECQALHPDPLDETVEDDEVGSGKYV